MECFQKVHMSQDEQLSKVGMIETLEREITNSDVGKSLKDLQVNNIPNPLIMNMYTLDLILIKNYLD